MEKKIWGEFMIIHTLIRVRENKAVHGWGLQYDNDPLHKVKPVWSVWGSEWLFTLKPNLYLCIGTPP